MPKHGTKKYYRLLLSSVLSAVLLLSAPATLAKNDLLKFADKVLAQSQSQQRRSQSRALAVQNELIDSSRSRTRDDQHNERVEIRVSLDQAVSKVRRMSGGKVIKASTGWSKGKPVHNIRVLTENNRVRTYRIDGVTGRQL